VSSESARLVSLLSLVKMRFLPRRGVFGPSATTRSLSQDFDIATVLFGNCENIVVA
jgi:hypothetical protein